MTTQAQVTALVDSHVKRDESRFRAIVLQIAADMAGRSEHIATRLRGLVNREQATCLTPLPSSNGLLSASTSTTSLDDMVLTPRIRARLDRVVLEQSKRNDLLSRNLSPTRKLLFIGPPGVGKTLAAGALAKKLGLPLFRVELHAVISSHLGETASKLSKVFEHVQTLPAVYLFDEFDALCSDRGSLGTEAAGAEMRRVVNSLLQFIEDDQSHGLIIATTNFSSILDRAILRRFDELIAFDVMSIEELTELTICKLKEFTTKPLDFVRIFAAAPSLGHADLCAVLAHVCKDHVLNGTPIDTTCIVTGIKERTRS